MDSVRAWLLNTSSEFYLATGEHELMEVLARPRTYRIPVTPEHCRQVIIWQDHLLPLLRPAFLAGVVDIVCEQPTFVAVAAWQEAPGEPLQYGALALAEAPVSIQVDPGPAIEPPPLNGGMKQEAIRDKLLLSCFKHEGKPVLVIDIKTLFTTAPARFDVNTLTFNGKTPE